MCTYSVSDSRRRRLGDLRVGVDLDVDRVDLADLQQVDHPPAVAGDREPLVARAVGEAEQVVGGLEALLHVAGPPQRPVARHEREPEAARVADLARQLDRLAAQLGATLARLGEAQLDRQSPDEPGAQRRIVVADRLERLLEQPHQLLVDDPASHLAGGSVAERGLAEQLRRAKRASRVGRLAERAVRLDRVACSGLGLAAREQQPAAALGVRERLFERLERHLVQARGLLVGEDAGRALGGALGVLDRLRRAAGRRREREVVRQLGQRRLRRLRFELLERLGHAQVQSRPARGGEAVVERLADQRVGEAAAAVDARHLGDHVRRYALLDHLVDLVLVEIADSLEHLDPELAAHHGRRGQQLARAL